MLIILLLLLPIIPLPPPSADALADFSRMSKALNTEVAIVDQEGVVREGILTAATKDDLIIAVGSGSKTFSREVVMSADRKTDSRKDGAIKGAIFGAILGTFVFDTYNNHGGGIGSWFTHVGVYSGIGYLLDAAQDHREPIYRGPSAPAVKVKLRF